MFIYITFIASLLILVEGTDQKWHTSQVALRKLYKLQKEQFSVFNDYLDLETKRLEELKNNLDAIHERCDHKVTKKNVYLHNHFNAIKAMTWLHRKLLRVDDLTNNKQSLEALKSIDEHKNLSEDHISLSYQALRRLQRFYAISASEMVAGRYNERIIGDQLDACECFVMSKYCFEEKDVYGVIDWAVEAYKKWKNENQPKCIDINELHYYLVVVSAFTGFELEKLLNFNGLRLPKATEKCMQHHLLIKNELTTMHEEMILKMFDFYNSLRRFMYQNYSEFINLCRGGISLPSSKKDLKCRYQTKNTYYRTLIPFKEEDINSDPYVKIYHDVLYDEEISKIKTIVSEKMIDARVRGSAFGSKYLIESTRSGQMNWIDDTADDLFYSLNARIESFTGFSVKSSENYQVVNYGLGGHYVPHHDMFQKFLKDKLSGSRIATVLFYLNEVENDGYTAYPLLNISVPVQKGIAIVWHNMYISNGDLHDGSLHGACPVLKGDKWIMTKWLREAGQNLPYDWKDYKKKK